MEQNTQVFTYGAHPEMSGNEFEYAEPYGEDEYGYAGYGEEGGYGGYEVGYDDGYGPEMDIPEEDYAVYDEGLDNDHRFHLAMNAFNTASVFTGLVVIFALTALIISLVSWIQTDISHSFVLLQSGIQ